MPNPSIHQCSERDSAFVCDFEACSVPPDQFDHRAHLRLAYVYLCRDTVPEAAVRMSASLRRYLAHLQADPAKFHQTMTDAWVRAVRHFMDTAPACADFAAFIEASPALLDTRIMLTHYSAQTLFSDQARQAFVAPDLQSIPPPPGSA